MQDTTGDVIYKVKFNAIVFRPFRGEVLDGEVIEITDNGFMIESGPLKSFISYLVRSLFNAVPNNKSLEDLEPVRVRQESQPVHHEG